MKMAAYDLHVYHSKLQLASDAVHLSALPIIINHDPSP